MQIVPLPALRDNYIWILVQGRRCLVVDPGEPGPVRAYLSAHGLEMQAILLTHRHQDHTGGVSVLIADQPVPVYGPAHDVAGVTEPQGEGDTISLAGFPELCVLEVPGHTTEHIAYVCGDLVFCGDTLFGAGCGRLLGGTAEQLFVSLQRLARLPAGTLLYCSHEYTVSNLRFAETVEPFNERITARMAACRDSRAAGKPTVPLVLAEELETNPFLRCHVPAVIDAAQRQAGRLLGNELAVFMALRTWKDQFV